LIARAEAALGFAIPQLLRACYLEIGNGGFGPGLGVMGVEGGHQSDYGDIIRTYQQIERGMPTLGKTWQPGLLPFCGWGCATLSCVQCGPTDQITTFKEGRVWRQHYSLADFFELWMKGIDILTYDSAVELSDLTVTNPFTKQPKTIHLSRRRDRADLSGGGESDKGET
jgi:hypothetical protein